MSRCKTKTTLERVSRELMRFYGAGFFSPSWEDIHLFHEGQGVIGEVRSQEDWCKLPKDMPLRVVLLETDTDSVLRWGDERMAEVLGGNTHSHLTRSGDDRSTRFKSGYITVRASGEIIVQA